MAREDMIRDAMRAVDTYNEIYEPTIKALAKTERQLSRAERNGASRAARWWLA